MATTPAENEEVYIDPEESLEEKAERKRTRSQRPRVARGTDDAGELPVAEDRKLSAAAQRAARAEALAEEEDEDGRITATYGDVEVQFDPVRFDLEFQWLCEQGKPMTGLAHVVGTENAQKFLRFPATELQNIIDSLAKQAGLGNS